MADIRPFAALRYASDADDLAAVTCPPYDVLSPAERAALIDRSPHATARLILPEGDGDAKYANAANLLAEWRRSGVLVEDATPGFYVTRTEFDEPGAATPDLRRHRLGLVHLLRLHEYADKVVLPHERTMTAPKADRLNLLRATRANVESILTLADDPEKALYTALEAVTTGAPIADFVGDNNERHTLWAVTDAGSVARLIELTANVHFYIADGHHRYETSLAYARENDAIGTDRPEAFILTTTVSMADPGIVLLPTHRLIKGEPAPGMFQHLETYFDVKDPMDLNDVESHLRLSIAHQPTFGMVLSSGTVYQLTCRDYPTLEAALPDGIDASLRGLDVTILQHLVLDQIFGIAPDEVATTDRLAYTRSAEEARERVESGEFSAALLLGRPPVEAVRDVSLAGEVMPQKSTFFYPKLVSGLVLRSL